MYQDDNAQLHRGQVMDAYMQQVEINRIDWQAYNPDLNPSEHIWDELDCQVRNNHIPPTDSQHLFQMLPAEWQALTQRYFTALVNSIRRLK